MSEKEEDLKQLNKTARKALDQINEADKAKAAQIDETAANVAETVNAAKTAEGSEAKVEAGTAQDIQIPKNINTLMDRLDDLINKMSALITNENSLLRSRDYKAVAKNAHKKNEYMRTYEALLKEFMNKKDALKDNISEQAKAELLEKAEKLQLALKKNHFFLQSVHISAKRVAERITKAIQNKLIDENATYNNRGLLNNGKEKHSAAVTDAAY